MKRIFNAKIGNWRIDDDGILRVTAQVMKEGVFDYSPEDVPEDSPLRSLEIVREFIPAAEFTVEALKSLEGKPLIINDHEWRTAENTLEDGLTVGNVAGTPRLKGKYILADFLIYAPEAIEKIRNGQLVEVSAGYDCDLCQEAGQHAGQEYAARQENLRFNHVLLLPEGQGRLGPDVRITNQKEKEDRKMSAGKKTANTEQVVNSEQLQEIMNKCAALDSRNEELRLENQDLQAKLAELKLEIEQLLAPESREELAREYNEQEEALNSIIEAELLREQPESLGNQGLLEKEKEQILNSIRQGKSLAQRRANAVRFVCSRTQRNVPTHWDQKAIDAAFEAFRIAAETHNFSRRQAQKTLNSGSQSGSYRVNNAGWIENNKSRLDRIYERG